LTTQKLLINPTHLRTSALTWGKFSSSKTMHQLIVHTTRSSYCSMKL